MSQLGQIRTSAGPFGMSGSTPGNGHIQSTRSGPFRANMPHWLVYSITSSACASSAGGTAMPSCFAVFRFKMSVNLSACSMGRSPGFAPRRILATWPPVIPSALSPAKRLLIPDAALRSACFDASIACIAE